MRRTAGALTLAILVLVQLVVLAPQSPAAGVLEFTCVGLLPQWPAANGSGGTCSGTGRFLEPSSECALGCSFSARFDEYEDDCAGLEGRPPITGRAWMSGGFPGSSYRIERTGFHVVYYKGDVPVGEGEWLPVPPMGSCGAPLPLTFHLTGRIAVL